jgi:hypothetical protein
VPHISRKVHHTLHNVDRCEHMTKIEHVALFSLLILFVYKPHQTDVKEAVEDICYL